MSRRVIKEGDSNSPMEIDSLSFTSVMKLGCELLMKQVLVCTVDGSTYNMYWLSSSPFLLGFVFFCVFNLSYICYFFHF